MNGSTSSLAAGDAVHFRADVPHALRNPHEDGATVLVVNAAGGAGPASRLLTSTERTPPMTRVAVVQAASIPFDSAATVAKAEGLIAECAAGGAELAVFPEAFIGCYPKGTAFGAVVGRRTGPGRDLYQRYFDAAVQLDGPEVATPDQRLRRSRDLRGRGRDRAVRLDALLHGADDRSRRRARRDPPQAHADRNRAADLGLRRRLHDRDRTELRRARRHRDLLGELHAGPATGDVRPGCRALLRADGRRPPDVDLDDDAHRAGGPSVRPDRLPGDSRRRLSGLVPAGDRRRIPTRT